MTENPYRETIFRPPFELVMEKNSENPQGPIWTWTLRHYAGSPLGYIVVGEFTTVDCLMSNDALEMILNKIVDKKEDKMADEKEKRVSRFNNPMDIKSIRDRLASSVRDDDVIYALAAHAAGEQNKYTVDVLSVQLKKILPVLIAAMAFDIEEENERRGI